jgi:hypothetical protein
MRQLEPRLLMGLVGLALLAGGLALAANFRGFTAWHARKSFESVRWLEGPLSHVPPWSFLLKRPLEERIAQQVRLARVIGVVFAAVGVMILIASVVARDIHTS